MGCKNIGVFVTNKDLGVVKERVKGALDVLENRGIKGRTKIFEISDIEDDKSIKSYLKTYQLDAVFSVDERLAIKIIKAAKQLNIEIPKELKIIGFADGILSKEYSPSLSTVDLHAEKIGALAVSQIIEKISKEPLKNEQQEILVKVKPTLIHRESA